MKKLVLLILFLLPIFGYSQCINEGPYNEIRLRSVGGIDTRIGLCYDDSSDYVLVKQSRVIKRLIIESADMGDFYLRKEYSIIFNGERGGIFRSKLHREEYIYEEVEEGDSLRMEVMTYRYYRVSKSKLRLVLNESIGRIDIIRDNDIDSFELSRGESIELYHMVYYYYRVRGWK